MRFEDGAVGTIEASRFCQGRKNHFTWEINGSKGSLAFDLERLNELQYSEGNAGFRTVLVSEADHPFWEHWWPQGHMIGWEHSFVHELHHLLTAIRDDARRRAARGDARGRLPRRRGLRRHAALGRAGQPRDRDLQELTLPTVLLIGTLDTKGDELAFVRARLRDAGVDVLVADAGTAGPPHGLEPDIGAARAGGRDRRRSWRRSPIAAPRSGRWRRPAAALARRLHDEGRIDGVLGAGGSGNTAIATAAMRALPVGVPKLMVSTMAAGDTRDYIGGSDIALMASVTDVAGLNSISARILANAAAAMAAMVAVEPPELGDAKPLIGATMFGVTTPCATRARGEPEARGYEVLVFHATGTGGKAMEVLVDAGFLAGVLDATTTELCDDPVGGVPRAGPDRLEAGGPRGAAAGRVGGRARHGQLRRARLRSRRSSRTATCTCTTPR